MGEIHVHRRWTQKETNTHDVSISKNTGITNLKPPEINELLTPEGQIRPKISISASNIVLLDENIPNVAVIPLKTFQVIQTFIMGKFFEGYIITTFNSPTEIHSDLFSARSYEYHKAIPRN